MHLKTPILMFGENIQQRSKIGTSANGENLVAKGEKKSNASMLSCSTVQLFKPKNQGKPQHSQRLCGTKACCWYLIRV